MPMVFEHGPFLAAAVLCDQAIEDKNGAISLIRVIDKVTASAAGPDAPQTMPTVQSALLWRSCSRLATLAGAT
jgi:hypothetical protein